MDDVIVRVVNRKKKKRKKRERERKLPPRNFSFFRGREKKRGKEEEGAKKRGVRSPPRSFQVGLNSPSFLPSSATFPSEAVFRDKMF